MNRNADRAGRRGAETESPTASGRAVSPAEDRDRQLAAAAWILGWIGGPLPAVAVLITTESPTWSRRSTGGAAVYWTAWWAVLLGLLSLELTIGVPAFAVWWIGLVVISLVVTVVATRLALRRSRESIHRRSW